MTLVELLAHGWAQLHSAIPFGLAFIVIYAGVLAGIFRSVA